MSNFLDGVYVCGCGCRNRKDGGSGKHTQKELPFPLFASRGEIFITSFCFGMRDIVLEAALFIRRQFHPF